MSKHMAAQQASRKERSNAMLALIRATRLDLVLARRIMGSVRYDTTVGLIRAALETRVKGVSLAERINQKAPVAAKV